MKLKKAKKSGYAESATRQFNYMNFLKKLYTEQIGKEVAAEAGITNPLAWPKIVKIVINISLKEAAHDKGVLEKASEQLATIAGQKPTVRLAKKAIANFKLREGDPIGLAVTLRGERMYDFMSKLFTIALPRVRDFHGVPKKSFDGQGNYTMGITEQIVFPEIEYAKIDKIRGLEITFVTNTKDDKIAELLLTKLGLPFEK